MVFTQKPIEEHGADFEPYRALFRELHGEDAPHPVMAGMAVCHEAGAQAEEMAHKYISGYLLSVMHHYELMGEHFKKVKGYEAYGDAVDTLRDLGLEGIAEMYVNAQAWGTPQQILDKLSHWREVLGPFDVLFGLRGAGMPYEDADRSQRLIAQQVIPELRLWDEEAKAA